MKSKLTNRYIVFNFNLLISEPVILLGGGGEAVNMAI